MCNKDFTHLHNHSFFSVQDALPSPAQLAKAAAEQGFTGIALTDHGRMGGHFDFAEAARANNIKPILGCEFYLAKDRFDKNNISSDGTKSREKLTHLTVLALNPKGYENLLKLGYEASNPDCYYYFPRIDFEFLSQNNEGLVVLSGCLASELQQTLLKSSYEDAINVAKKFKDVFGERYFIELQYHGIEEQKHNLPHLVKLAKDLDIKTVASNDVHYVAPSDWKLHDVLIQMKDLRDEKTTSKANTGKKEAYGSHQFYLKSYDEMFKIFGARVPEALSNTKLIEEMVEDYYQIDLPHLLPEGKIAIESSSFQSFWKNKLPHHDANEAYLAYQALSGLKELGLNDKPEYLKRLKYEIETVWYMGVTDYFLIQKEMVDFMKSNDILYGIRGSGVGSLLNFCLGISLADPIKFNLMFERFLNPGRGNQYKIDLEQFEHETSNYDEQECINYVRLKCKEFLSIQGNEKYESRISRELWILENQKFMTLLKAAVDVNHKLIKNASNFVTFYVLGLASNIPTENLIIKKVAGLPDIDTDIDDSRRQEVIDWAKQRFGEENVKSVGTWGTYKAKAAILGTLKTSDKFKKSYADNLAQMALKVSSTIPNKPGTTIESAMVDSPDFAYWAKKFPEETNNASNLNGVISNMGIHAAAVVVSKKPIHLTVPVENSKGTRATAFDMKNVERTGIVKYDLLGLATYRQLSLALKQIKKRHDIQLDLRKIPLDDNNVFKHVFEKGNTVSVFQFSGAGMQKALKEIKASTMDDLIAVAALYRPGPMDYIPDYAKGKLNPSLIKYSHPIIEKHLAPTYGIMVYQEQAMFLSREMASLDWLDVDKLRKGIAKKSGKQFDESCSNFARKALAMQTPQNAVNDVLQLMSKFGGYAFNKSHSCMYAIVGYWTAYLKHYYPAEWMSACIEADKDDSEKIDIYLRECERLNIKVQSANVNQSGLITSVSNDGVIYLPITSLKGVGASGSSIVDNAPYSSLQDFADRSGCNKSLYVALAAGGALNSLVDDNDVDEEYFLDFWLEFSKNKAKSKKSFAKINVDNNTMSLLEIRNLSKKKNESGESLLSMLEDF